VRWDAGVESGSVVGVDFDPMLAKVVAHAPTRAEAAGRLALALERLHIGGVATNRDLLAATLRHPAFLAGDTTTDFIDRVAPAARLGLTDAELERAAALAALWLQGENRAQATALGRMPSGWRIGRLPAQRVTLALGERTIEVRYQARRDGTFALAGPDRTARIHAWSPAAIDAEVGGRRATAQVTRAGERLYVQTVRGTVAFAVVPRFVVPGAEAPTGGLVAPMPGVVLDVRCAPGDVVDADQTLVVLEAMKMEHQVRAPTGGVIAEVRVVKGQHIENGAVLLMLDPVEPVDRVDGSGEDGEG
jgi:propionyl-CoA carboxylase alpha chain